jgi:hypothetical protein
MRWYKFAGSDGTVASVTVNVMTDIKGEKAMRNTTGVTWFRQQSQT